MLYFDVYIILIVVLNKIKETKALEQIPVWKIKSKFCKKKKILDINNQCDCVVEFQSFTAVAATSAEDPCAVCAGGWTVTS